MPTPPFNPTTYPTPRRGDSGPEAASTGGAVSSVFGRTGAVVAVAGDYTSSLITNASTVPGSTVSDALDWLAANAGTVTSVFGRTGAVAAASGDYAASQITNDSGVTGVGVAAALNTLNAAIDLTGARVVNGPSNTFLKGTGAGNSWATLFTTPANPGDNGKVVLASAGDFSYLAGSATGNALIWSGAAWAAGNDFGSQSLTTTGGFIGNSTAAFLRLGLAAGSGSGVASAAATGQIRGARGAAGFVINVRNQADTADLIVLSTDTTTSPIAITIGTTSLNGLSTIIASPAAGSVTLRAGASSSQLQVTTNGVAVTHKTIEWGASVATPELIQHIDPTNGVTGQLLTIRAQRCSGTTSTGGSIDIGPGAGTSASGLGRLITSSGPDVQKFAWNDTGIGFYATAPVTKPTITGSRGGNAALADLLTKVAAQGLFTDGTSA